MLSSFIGRDDAIADVTRLLSTARLVTLTGAGGCGKTRLAIRVVSGVLERFAGGVWFVDLAALSDSQLVPQTVAVLFDVRDAPGRTLTEGLARYLHERPLLLLLDNCEHLLMACAQLAESLLQACPQLVILVTSREPLAIGGEQTYHVPSLSVPYPLHTAPRERLTEYESVRLFHDRAVAVQPGFRLTDQNGPAVAQICMRLEGMPLAIELAAARVKALSVEQIAARLNDRFDLLTGGNRTALPRQQTLRGTIDWSYSLLSEPERVLLRRLSVFAGGWTLEAAEATCVNGERDGISPNDVLDLLTRLIDKSLVVWYEQIAEPRYRMLETVRQYASEKLADAGEDRPLRMRHQAYYVGLAQAAEPNLRGANQGLWFRRLESERPNFRAAIEWSRGSDDTGKALQLVDALFWFWNVMGHHREGADLCRDVLARPESLAPTVCRAKVLASTGLFLWTQGNPIEAHALAAQALSISESLDDKSATALSLWALGLINMSRGDFDSAGEHLRRCLAISRESGYLHHVGDTLHNLGILAIHAGDYQGARTHCEESVRIYRGLGDRPFLAFTLRWLAYVVAHEGDIDRAVSLLKECLTLAQEWGGKRGIAAALAGLAATSALRGDLLRATRLFGAAEAILELMMTDLLPQERELVDQNIMTLRGKLDTNVFNRAWAEGRLLTLEQAIMEAERVAAAPALASTTLPLPREPNALTSRELDVLRLVAAGMSDAQIAEQLVISRRTVQSHLTSIFGKFGVNSRSAAAHHALGHNIL
jgi:non-specific serine/threonine protein kinase